MPDLSYFFFLNSDGLNCGYFEKKGAPHLEDSDHLLCDKI